jgi:hypothetical protein
VKKKAEFEVEDHGSDRERDVGGYGVFARVRGRENHPLRARDNGVG